MSTIKIDTREQAAAFLDALERGELRAAQPDGDGGWQINESVKRGIMDVFRLAKDIDLPAGAFSFRDRDLLIPADGRTSPCRVVPGGTVIRRGAFVANNVVIMPPAYVNVGAYVSAGAMIDSHALIGSCAQIGTGVHVSAGAQIGGVLEPISASPVIVEDECFVGGNCGVYEGVRVRSRAVLAAGVVMSASTVAFDLVNEREIRAEQGILEIPEGAVVVPGTRQIASGFGAESGLGLSAAIIVKYRDDKTDARTAMEGALRRPR